MSEILVRDIDRRPHLEYDKEFGCLNVRFVGDCQLGQEINTCAAFSLNMTANRKKNVIGFITFYCAKSVLYDAGYRYKSISLENFMKIFERHNPQPFGMSVYGHRKQLILALVRKHPFVWHINK